MTTLKTWPGTADEDLPMAYSTTINIEINKILKKSKMIKTQSMPHILQSSQRKST